MSSYKNSLLNSQNYTLNAKYTFNDIIGESTQIKTVLNHAKNIANTPSTVLITASSGCGKELLAQAIHNASSVKNGPFVALNCGAISKNLIESELFGYESGAFTGAKSNGSIGKFQLANNGTIFLDEIGEMPLDMQVNLLRVIQERYIVPIGSKNFIPINVRIIAATNKDLRNEIKEGTFRKDLFYRLNVIPITIPDLKDRKGDIPILIDYFIHKKSKKLKKPIPRISDNLYKKMLSYCWPGNIRELENCVENIVILNGKTTYEMNFDECTCMDTDNLGNPIIRDSCNNISNIYDTDITPLKILEEKEIKKSLILCNGNISLASEKLGISRNTLYTKMKKHNISLNKYPAIE